jgi:hypothetical protein
MTEAEWLACPNPNVMVPIIRWTARDRKLRLFACACCRRIWHLLPKHSRKAVEVAERFAEGLATEEERSSAVSAAHYKNRATSAAASTLLYAGYDVVETWAHAARAVGAGGEEKLDQELSYQSILLRDIFGNPFRPVSLNSAWLTPTVTALAQALYDARNFADLPILADALEENGCTSQELLDHLRGPGPHVLGCWALDLVLGNS